MKTETAPKASIAKHHLKLLTGSTIGKYPVVLDNGKTIIFISDKSKEEETRQKYKLRGLNSNLNIKQSK